MDEQPTADVRGFTDEMMMTLAGESVKAIVALIGVSQQTFARQLASLHLDDDLVMTSRILNRVLARLGA